MESIGAWISKLRDSAIEMAENIAYIRKELPAWDLPDEIRAAIVGLCDSFGSALCEVPDEIVALNDELRSRSGETSPESNAGDADPEARMSHLVALLREQTEALHGVVTDLDSARETDSSVSAVYVLVTESGANILNALIRMREVEDAIAAGLDGRR